MRLLSQSKDDALKRVQQLRADYRAAFSTASGIRVLEDLSKRCFVKTSTFKDFDTNSMINREGKRSVFLHIQTMCEKPKKELLRKAKK